MRDCAEAAPPHGRWWPNIKAFEFREIVLNPERDPDEAPGVRRRAGQRPAGDFDLDVAVRELEISDTGESRIVRRYRVRRQHKP